MKRGFARFFVVFTIACGPVKSPGSHGALTPGECVDDRCRLLQRAFPDDRALIASCRTATDERELVDCIAGGRFAEDEAAQTLVRRLYAEHGIVTGIEPAHVMDDGDYRGRVDVEPRAPIGDDRRHLEGLLDALDSVDATLSELARHGAQPLRFVRKPAVIRFFETRNATTPSAYAEDATIAYNLRGECWASPFSVFETLVHELFHLSDIAHGNWSARALGEQYDAIRARCQGDQSCLEPYAPHETKVDGGIFYAFHPTSDVREYAAELATRYVREQRERLWTSLDAPRPFKCLASDNEVVWKKLADEFFGGVDLTPPC